MYDINMQLLVYAIFKLYHSHWKKQLISFLPALPSRTVLRVGGSIAYVYLFDDAKVFTIVYFNKEYLNFVIVTPQVVGSIDNK